LPRWRAFLSELARDYKAQAGTLSFRRHTMDLPGSLTERLPFLEAFEADWQPVSRAALVIAVAFYAAIMIEEARTGGGLLDLVFVPVHEGGHLLFRWFGEFMAVAGGTFLQLAAPFSLAVYFAFQRNAVGVSFCLFFFFQQFLPIAVYMADARAQQLPLLTVGDSEYVIHDWNYLFGKLGLLEHDVQIAGTVRIFGWLGMLGVTLWLLRRELSRTQELPGSEPG
jgi:hypothetical protein